MHIVSLVGRLRVRCGCLCSQALSNYSKNNPYAKSVPRMLNHYLLLHGHIACRQPLWCMTSLPQYSIPSPFQARLHGEHDSLCHGSTMTVSHDCPKSHKGQGANSWVSLSTATAVRDHRSSWSVATTYTTSNRASDATQVGALLRVAYSIDATGNNTE